LDRDSVCHAIGIILDGLATDKGDSSRGARYNSAVRYYEYFGKNHPTVLVIISEDGMINLIPDLNPQIKHSSIREAIEHLKELSKNTKQDKKQFNYLMNYFENVEFYLTTEECKTINALRKKIEKNDKNEGIEIVREDLKPNKEMNESYYLD
jgi:alkaline phosphatase